MIIVILSNCCILFFRGAEIIFSLALAHNRLHGEFQSELYPSLLNARKELALFQHHDGITGTATESVVADYGRRMYRAILESSYILEHSANFLLTKNKKEFQKNWDRVPIFKLGESRAGYDRIPVKDVLIVADTPRMVVFYNSLAQGRKQTVFMHISEPFVQVGFYYFWIHMKIIYIYCFIDSLLVARCHCVVDSTCDTEYE